MPERVLFRGQVVSSKLHRVGELTQITLELEDYNRLLSMIQILPEVPGSRTPDGIPYSISFISEGDTGPTGFNKYWNVRNGGPDADITTYVTADAASAGWSGTEEGDLGSFMAASAATTGGPIRYWVGWPDFYDPDGPGLYLHWQNVDPTDPTTIVASGDGTDTPEQRAALGWAVTSTFSVSVTSLWSVSSLFDTPVAASTNGIVGADDSANVLFTTSANPETITTLVPFEGQSEVVKVAAASHWAAAWIASPVAPYGLSILWDLDHPESAPVRLGAEPYSGAFVAGMSDSVVVGIYGSEFGLYPAFWSVTDPTALPTVLGTLPGQQSGWAVASQGSKIIGSLQVDYTTWPVMWDTNNPEDPPIVFAFGTNGSATSIDGSWVVGSSNRYAAAWSLNNPSRSIALGVPADFDAESEQLCAFGVSGSRAVGQYARSDSTNRPMLWDLRSPSSPPVELPLPTGAVDCMAISISGDVIAGWSIDDDGNVAAVFWNATDTATSSPADLDYDTPNWTSSIMPTQMELSWDWASARRQAWVAGGTPHPVGSGYVTNTTVVGYSGTEIINAPGSLEKADVDAIGSWHLAHDYSGFLRGSATIPAVHPYTGGPINGWRVGQVVRVSSLNNDLLYQPAIVSRPVAITSVRGRLAGTGGGLRLFPGGRHDLDMAAYMTWKSFSVEEVLGSPGKATVTLELWENPPAGPYDAPFGVGPLLDLWITTDDTDPIEWDLEFGDMPLGSLSREVALAKTEKPNKPIYRFHTEVDDSGIPVGGTTMVRAQCADISGANWSIAGVQTEWLIRQYVETEADGCSRDPDTGLPTTGCATIGTGITVADPVSVTDDTGLATVTLSRAEGTTKTWWVEAVSLPVN